MTSIVIASAGALDQDVQAPGKVHSLADDLVGLRVVGWMNTRFPDAAWWMCAVRGGRFNSASNVDPMHWFGKEGAFSYAKQVLAHVNKQAAYDGAWLAGWIEPPAEGAQEIFYLLWKDRDGDINIPIQNPLGWMRIRGWKPEDHEEHCHQAHRVWAQWHKDMALKPDQYAKVAQGEKVSAEHFIRSAGLIPT